MSKLLLILIIAITITPSVSKLTNIISFTRHGARAPYNKTYLPILIPYWKNYSSGELTEVGMR